MYLKKIIFPSYHRRAPLRSFGRKVYDKDWETQNEVTGQNILEYPRNDEESFTKIPHHWGAWTIIGFVNLVFVWSTSV